MIRWKQAVDGFPDFGMTFENPDFVKYAEAYGARGTRVHAVDELQPALEAAFAGGGVHLVVVPIDYSENQRVLVDELRRRLPAAAREILSRDEEIIDGSEEECAALPTAPISIDC
jgi:acetolactate synthase-1/2/3 large subunit